MNKLLVLCDGYPDLQGGVALNYVRTRVVYYKKKGVDVTVLNYNSQNSYVIDDVKVLCLNDYLKSNEQYDVLVSHAPNIKCHYRFLKKYNNRFKKLVFFYHGHEVLNINKEYPKEYTFVKKKSYRKVFFYIYDTLKLKLWKHFITSNISKIELVFVSQWMYDSFIKYVKIREDLIKERYRIIYNCAAESYINNTYEYRGDKKYDVITIRPNIDTSKFAIDLVNRLAFLHPDLKFLLVGKGCFFNYNKKAPNIERIEKYLNQEEIIDLLNMSRVAYMPTRLDAQGVMACEMATYGIPLITSDIPVCRYVLDGFDNVFFVPNNAEEIDLTHIMGRIKNVDSKNLRFSVLNTIDKELELLNNL